jgi:hypothetical protein
LLYVSFDSPGDGGILAINQTDGTTVTTIDRAAKMLGVGVEPLRAPSNRTVPAPPVLEVVERSVTILMEKFIFPRASRALRQSSAQVSTATARQRPEYEIRVRGNGKNFIRRTKANKFTLRGLRSGSYTAKYRVRYKQGSKQRQTKFSPEQAFTVT